ncbi:hypothetical protein GE21DRAFT_1354728 [Neurospora crassa]|nr:hypothetical protein GE21DRAFT_1354728 [Neurospora crassa]
MSMMDHLQPEGTCSNLLIFNRNIFITSLPSVYDLRTFLYACSNTALEKLSPGEAVDWYIHHVLDEACGHNGWEKRVISGSNVVFAPLNRTPKFRRGRKSSTDEPTNQLAIAIKATFEEIWDESRELMERVSSTPAALKFRNARLERPHFPQF